MADESYPHLMKADGQPARLKRVPRTRVSMIVRDYLNFGWSVEEMCNQHPYLKPSEAHSAMAYYFDHKAEIDAEIDEEDKQFEADLANRKPTPVEVKLRAKGLIPPCR